MSAIIILYTQLPEKMQENGELYQQLQSLPENLRANILKYQDRREQALRMGGKLLLSQMLQYFNLGHLSLENIQKSGNNKPYFPSSGFQFNVAHSGNICICAGAMQTHLGVDIEQIKPINIAQFSPYLTEKEQLLLSESPTPMDAFYKIWVKKEAVLKVTGNTLDEQFLNKTETQEGPVKWNKRIIYTEYLHLEEHYIACLASDNTIDTKTLVVKKVNLNF